MPSYGSSHILMLPPHKISPNPRQPRRHFDEAELRSLADSIRRHGILQPLTVQKGEGGCYFLIAGERRLRAAGLAGLSKVPCILLRASDEDRAILALVENIQRRDLHYIEEAAAIAALIGRHGLTREEAAEHLGYSQSALANKLRLLRLSEPCIDLLRRFELTERHARAALRLADEELRLSALRHMGEKELNVAAAESYVDTLLQNVQQEPPKRRSIYIIKDVRLFLNSIRRSMNTMRLAGVDAKCDRSESDEEIVMTIRIPKRVAAAKPAL